MYELLFSSQQPKAKDFRRHCCNVIFPQIRQWLTNKMKEEYQKAITDRDNQIKALAFGNEEHQHEILRLNKQIDNLIKNRHVARRGCFDNVLCFIKKKSKEAHPYYVIRCQYRQLEKYKRRENFLRLPLMSLFKTKEFCSLHHRLWNVMMILYIK